MCCPSPSAAHSIQEERLNTHSSPCARPTDQVYSGPCLTSWWLSAFSRTRSIQSGPRFLTYSPVPCRNVAGWRRPLSLSRAPGLGRLGGSKVASPSYGERVSPTHELLSRSQLQTTALRRPFSTPAGIKDFGAQVHEASANSLGAYGHCTKSSAKRDVDTRSSS